MPMGEIVSLEEYRDRRNPEVAMMRRLEHAVGRLDSVVQRRPGKLAPTVERELLLIARAVRRACHGMRPTEPSGSPTSSSIRPHPAPDRRLRTRGGRVYGRTAIER